MRLNVVKVATAILVLANIVAACSLGGYESGDGPNSYLESEFGQLCTDANAKVNTVALDNGKKITLKKLVSMNGAKADTIYRGLVYYESKSESDNTLMGFTPAHVCQPATLKEEEKMKTDPVEVESFWMSKNGSYMNMALLLKTGVKDDTSKHVLGVIKTAVSEGEGPKNYDLTFYHDQGGVPEYYTSKIYVSIPVAELFQKGDQLSLSVNTYNGERNFSVTVQ